MTPPPPNPTVRAIPPHPGLDLSFATLLAGFPENPNPPESLDPPTLTPIVSLPTCLIRPFHPSDVKDLAHHGNNPKIACNLHSTFPQPYTADDASSWITSSRRTVHPIPPHPLVDFAICTPVGGPEGRGSVIGTIGLHPAGIHKDTNRSLEIGYWIGEEYWGKGIATAAVRGFVDWAFENMPAIERIAGTAYSHNKGSIRVMQKVGFVLEGCRRKAEWKKDGGFFDIVDLGLLREDWQAQREGQKHGEES